MRAKYIMMIILLLAVVTVGCEWDEDLVLEEQPVWFEYHYINHAWGFQENGWLIDGEGNVRVYDLPENYRLGMHGKFLSLEDLEYNLSQTDSVREEIDLADLNQYIQMIPGAATGNIGRETAVAADAGSSVLSAYLYDAVKDSFQYILLGRSGDWEQLNQSEEAEKLVDWLRGFNVFWLSD